MRHRLFAEMSPKLFTGLSPALVPALLLCLLAGPARAWQDSAATPGAPPAAAVNIVPDAQAAEPGPEKILVVGQRPGPGLWKISKGDHVLWIFGTYSPLPAKMEWRAQQVESIIAQSQAFLLPPSASTQVGFFRQLTLLPYAIGVKKNPDGARLADLMPPEVHQRWLLLKQKYIGDDEGIERERPVFAAQTLYSKGMAHAGLSSGNDVRKAIEAIVKKNNIKMFSSNVKLAMDDPVKVLKDFKKSPLDDVPCFAKTLDSLETDIAILRVHANAWAKGDVEALRKLNFAEREEACTAALTNSAFIKGQPQFQNVVERMKEAWLATAEKSLADNASTFAMLPLKAILEQDGYVSALRARGYEMQSPE